MIRPELRASLHRLREVIAAAGSVALGLWLVSLGGYILQGGGAVIALTGLGWLMIAWRRLRFAREVAAPGLVELDEGQIAYFGTGQMIAGAGNIARLGLGGQVALHELAEIRLLRLQGQQYWRLRALDGQALVIPVAAAGAEALYDAFASLPGIDMGALAAALDRRDTAQSLWTRPAPSRDASRLT